MNYKKKIVRFIACLIDWFLMCLGFYYNHNQDVSTHWGLFYAKNSGILYVHIYLFYVVVF